MTIHPNNSPQRLNDDTNSNTQVAITGIGTDVGKTVVAAIVAEALGASYWKPIQAGDLTHSDSHKIQALTSDRVRVLPEAVRLSQPMSPHAAAQLDGITIKQTDLALPVVDGNLVVEGAGGLLVPINTNGFLLADALKMWGLPIIVVSRHYVGSINHTLLTIEAIKQRQLPLVGLVFVGDSPTSEAFILQQTGVKLLLTIPHVEEINTAFIAKYAEKIRPILAIPTTKNHE